MLRFVLATLLATSIFAAPSAPPQLPDVFEPCPTSSPDFEGCAKRNLQKGVAVLSDGLPALDVPPLDPLIVPEVLLDYRTEAAEGKMIVRNSESRGIKDIDILDFRANLSDPSNLVIDVDFRIPAVVVKGEYKVEGKVAGFPISGKGVYNISMRDVTGTWGVRGDIVTIDGDEYMKVRHVNVLPEVGDMQVYASNLFTGSDELDKAALRFANLYWPTIYKELLPFAAEGWDKFLRGQLNKFFLKFPFRAIFPEN